MKTLEAVISANRAYWSRRAPSFSYENSRDDICGSGYGPWLRTIEESIAARFPGRAPEEIRVLDIATGPGFFAIILARAGYRVTAVDLTPSMLEMARQNAGETADLIDFLEMDAEALAFPDGTFDVIVTRNLTWNLPHPAEAYREWHRVLRPGGMMLNFDANWYRYLIDDEARDGFDADRANAAEIGIVYNDFPEVDYDEMERIAEALPLTRGLRPAWDVEVLTKIGFSASADTEVWRKLWNDADKVNYASTPMFMVSAVKS